MKNKIVGHIINKHKDSPCFFWSKIHRACIVLRESFNENLEILLGVKLGDLVICKDWNSEFMYQYYKVNAIIMQE